LIVISILQLQTTAGPGSDQVHQALYPASVEIALHSHIQLPVYFQPLTLHLGSK